MFIFRRKREKLKDFSKFHFEKNLREEFVCVACFFVEFFVSKDEHSECEYCDSIFVFSVLSVESFSESDFSDSIVDPLEEKASKIENSLSNLCVSSSTNESSNVSSLKKSSCVREKKIRFLEKKFDVESSVAIFCETNSSRFLSQIESCSVEKKKIEFVSRSKSFENCVSSERSE